MDRNARSALHQRQTRIARQAKATQAVEFFNILTSPQLLDTTEALLPEYRERLGQRKLVAWVNSVSAPTCGAFSLSEWPAKRPLEPKLSLDPRLLSWAR